MRPVSACASLMFNSLVKKNEKFEYVADLASNIQRSDDGLTFTFTLRDGVTFHDGRPFTSADAKYTLDTVLANTFAKSASFFEGAGANRNGYIKSVEAPDARTLVIRLNKQWTGLLPNLVPIAHHSQRQLRITEDASAWHRPLQIQELRSIAAGGRSRSESELLGRASADGQLARAGDQ